MIKKCSDCEKEAELRTFVEVDAGGITHHEVCDECFNEREREQYDSQWFIDR